MIVIAAGKPRPAVIVQADRVQTREEVLVCPFTTHLIDADLYRPTVLPTDSNGLKAPSQMMTDKIAPAVIGRIGSVIGRLDSADILRLNVALALVLDIDQ